MRTHTSENQAARRLFAERDITTVGIGDIAEAAGVSHGLVQRYCGTREKMTAEIAPIIARAELAGIEPGTMIQQGRPTPAMRLAVAIRHLQAQARLPTSRPRMSVDHTIAGK